METSEQINEIALALSQFQAEVQDAGKDTKAYNYSYAKLDQIFDIIRPLLGKHGLCFTQPATVEENQVIVETWIIHKSGQYFKSKLCMSANFEAKGANSLQKIGMAISYAKRYSIMSALGCCQKDDDDDAQSLNEKPQAPRYEQKEQKPARADKPIGKEKAAHLLNLINEAGEDAMKLRDVYKIKKAEYCPESLYYKLVSVLNKKIEKAKAEQSKKESAE